MLGWSALHRYWLGWRHIRAIRIGFVVRPFTFTFTSHYRTVHYLCTRLAHVPLSFTFYLLPLPKALAKLGLKDDVLLEQLAMRSLRVMGEFNPEALAHIVNAYAKLGNKHVALFSAIAKQAVMRQMEFEQASIVALVTGFAKIAPGSTSVITMPATQVGWGWAVPFSSPLSFLSHTLQTVPGLPFLIDPIPCSQN